MIPIPLWLRLAGSAVLASGLIFGGYKIGAWKEAAAGAKAAKDAADALATCNASIAAQREADLTGANHALEDQLQTAKELANHDALVLADAAKKMRSDALAFNANTRAIYEVVAGSCSFTPEFVGLLIRASDQANSSNRDRASRPASPKAGSGDGRTAPIPNTSGGPRPATEGRTGEDRGRPLE